MIKSSIFSFTKLISNFRYNASFYKTAQFFSEMQAVPGSIEKQTKITAFRKTLPENDLKQFDDLMNHINNKVKIGVTTKLVQNYYVKKNVPQGQRTIVQAQLVQGKEQLSNKLCVEDKQSQMTLYDVNIFLKYIREVKGAGSQAQKAYKIINVVKNVSKLEGLYFLRLIDHKLTIGAKAKTFKNAKLSQANHESKA